MDKYDKATRSRMMSAVRSRGNRSTEMRMVDLLKGAGLRGWRRHHGIPGRPDFCWPKLKVALFVDGCFWHGCPYCRRPPKSNVEFWESKVAANQRRDRRVSWQLRRRGWSVVRVRECKLGTRGALNRIVRALARRGHDRALAMVGAPADGRN
ncbi:very short patch repair endonuclease [Planctomycetota bacterium]